MWPLETSASEALPFRTSQSVHNTECQHLLHCLYVL